MHQPVKAGLHDSVAHERRKDRLAGQSKEQLAIDLDDRRAAGLRIRHRHLLVVILLAVAVHSRVVRDVAATDDFAFNNFSVVIWIFELQFLTFIERE